MSTRSYWADLFTWTTWQEFLAAGGQVSGFRERSWKTVQRIKPGDYLLCYLVGIHRWIGILEVTSDPFQDSTPIWKDDLYPCRMRVNIVASLTADTAVPIHDLRDRLSVFQGSTDPRAWGVYLQRSPTRWKESDGEAVLGAVLEAQKNPVVRPVSKARLNWKPQVLRTRKGALVTVPDDQEKPPSSPEPSTTRSAVVPNQAVAAAESSREATLHTEIQWRLLKLGSDMNLDVWVAKNDRGRSYDEHTFADLPRLKRSLPVQFDEATNRTIELIDVLWLRGNAIVAAFEVESTTSIYSGLLRMSDLVTMQPNLNIPLYIVAPDERREKVVMEVNRPTFSRLSPPLHQICKFIPFSTLRQRMDQLGPMVRYLRPEFLEELSESCALEQV